MKPIITKPELFSAFSRLEANAPIEKNARLAAIAIIFFNANDSLHLCLGRRTINPLDPWSGDLAFPGGKAEAHDLTLHDVAARETFEEVGLRLAPQTLIGCLPKMDAAGGRAGSTMPVWPLIYLLDEPPAPFRLSDEMSDARWVLLNDLWNRQAWMAFSFPPTRAQRYGINVADHFLWGFSLQVLIAVSDELGHSLRPIRALEKVVHPDLLAQFCEP